MEAHPPVLEPERSPVEAEPRGGEAAPPIPSLERPRDLVPWVTEIAFVTGILVLGLVIFLVLTSGQNPFATALIPVILVLAAIAAVVRHRQVRRHQANADFVHARHAARERRGF